MLSLPMPQFLPLFLSLLLLLSGKGQRPVLYLAEGERGPRRASGSPVNLFTGVKAGSLG